MTVICALTFLLFLFTLLAATADALEYILEAIRAARVRGEE